MSPGDWTERVAAYYRAPSVRARIAEYCGGGREAESFSCWRIGGYGGRRRLQEDEGAPIALDNAQLDGLLDEGADVCRSLADRRGTLLLLDVDYVSPLEPGEPYRHPGRTFARLEPVYEILRELFAAYGVKPRILLNGRGYHFTARVPFDSPFHARLVGVASVADSVVLKSVQHAPGLESAVLMGLGHDGAGRLLEHLAHRVLHRLRGRTEVPLTLADVPPPGGGPFICLDLSAYADPVFERQARCAFSTNQRAGMQQAAPDLSARAAATADASLSAATDGAAWIEEYLRSPLGRFHREFDRGPQAPVPAWPFTYDSLETSDWPACLRVALDHPNPLLLRPVHLRTLALGLWSMGWHPRSIAGLVRSKYERDHGWGDLFRRYDAAGRAEFYVRLFCGAAADGLDEASDFTCETQARRGVCEPGLCDGERRRSFAWLSEGLAEKSARTQ